MPQPAATPRCPSEKSQGKQLAATTDIPRYTFAGNISLVQPVRYKSIRTHAKSSESQSRHSLHFSPIRQWAPTPSHRAGNEPSNSLDALDYYSIALQTI
jgi:hypothetical protein